MWLGDGNFEQDISFYDVSGCYTCLFAQLESAYKYPLVSILTITINLVPELSKNNRECPNIWLSFSKRLRFHVDIVSLAET
jgi:hypothetical protein